MLKLNYSRWQMIKSKHASTMIYSLMLGLVILIMTIALAPSGKQVIDDAMNASTSDFIGLDCDNDSISNFDKATCVVTDFSLFWFFGALICIAGAVVGGRIIFQ